MNKLFRNTSGVPVDIVKHTLNVIANNTDVEIHVGTDSQNHRRETVYVTAIAYRYGNRGVHYIIHKIRVKKIKDRWTRLWNEAEMTIDTAEYLSKKISSLKIQLDFDYNVDERYFSNKLVQASHGWGTSLGYKVNMKPDNQIATKAADYHCR